MIYRYDTRLNKNIKKEQTTTNNKRNVIKCVMQIYQSYGSKLHISPTNYHLLTVQQKPSTTTTTTTKLYVAETFWRIFRRKSQEMDH